MRHPHPHGAALGALLTLLVAASGCGPRTGARHARGRFDARSLSGVWIGKTRDQPTPGVRRSTAVLLQLQAADGGGLKGRLRLEGALGSGLARKLLCTDTRRAQVHQTASLTKGRFDRQTAQWTLSGRALSGVKACQHRFPLGGRCQARATGAGQLRLTCGPLTVPLRQVTIGGVWVWDEERTDRSGDTVIHRLRLHLQQRGHRARGYIDDIHVRISGDGQRYRCNGRLRYDQQARHRVQGRLRGRRLSLQVTATAPKQGPCQGRVELPPTLQGTWSPLAHQLRLTVGGDERVLWQRPMAPAAR